MRTAKEVGVIVRQLRGDMSLRDFAKKCGMSHTTIDNIEKGEDFRTGKPVQIKITTLQKIADACNVPITYIIGEEQQDSNTPVSAVPTDADLKFALFNGASDATDEMLNEVRRYAAFIYHKEKQPTKV